jgi:hypothetical protein
MCCQKGFKSLKCVRHEYLKSKKIQKNTMPITRGQILLFLRNCQRVPNTPLHDDLDNQRTSYHFSGLSGHAHHYLIFQTIIRQQAVF